LSLGGSSPFTDRQKKKIYISTHYRKY
jgi:hypothetical protein